MGLKLRDNTQTLARLGAGSKSVMMPLGEAIFPRVIANAISDLHVPGKITVDVIHQEFLEGVVKLPAFFGYRTGSKPKTKIGDFMQRWCIDFKKRIKLLPVPIAENNQPRHTVSTIERTGLEGHFRVTGSECGMGSHTSLCAFSLNPGKKIRQPID